MEEVRHISMSAVAGVVIVGAALLFGLVVGYYNIKSAEGPRERRYVRRACETTALLALLLIVALLRLPNPWRFIALAVFLFGFPVLIYRWSTNHQLLRELERRERKESDEGNAP